MHRLFGTDGVRGAFGRPPMDQETVSSLGYQLARRLAERDGRPHVLIGGDPRESTPTLTAWLTAGLRAGSADVSSLGILPTPGVACMVRHLGADCGVVISASHNLHPDNGIKLIDREGFKWTVEAETELERRMSEAEGSFIRNDTAEPPATVDVLPYLESLTARFEADDLRGLHVALDLANGAASPYAAQLFEDLGASVEAISDRPDGTNINRRCGSTSPEAVAAQVRTRSCDLGAAFDGDADRVVFCDASGRPFDGDATLYLWARALKESGRLAPPTVVATTMSNLGLERSLSRHGIGLLRCDVGDREVVGTLRRRHLILGGEQSGHIVNLDLSTAGDGMQTALHIARLIVAAERPVADLLADLERYPQILRNVPVAKKREFESVPAITAAVEGARHRLGDEGRLLLRYSGTEPLARIMIEGADPALIESLAEELATLIHCHLGSS